jgi:hypothetical protein
MTRVARLALSLTAMSLTALFSVSLVSCQKTAEPATEQPEEAEAQETITGGKPFHGLLPYRKKDAKLALIRPSFVSAEEAALAPGVSVVGVSVGSTHRAYPLYVLKNHQIVNDRLGEVPVAASW